MWLFTKNGFFSAVQHFGNASIIHVRSRFEGDLERLCSSYRIIPNVEYTPENDYPYRMNFDRGVWSKIVEGEALDVDYDNFKNRVHDGTPRDRAYMGVWAALRANESAPR